MYICTSNLIYIRYFEWELTLQQGWFKSNQQIAFSWRNEDFTPDFTWINHGIHGATRGIGGTLKTRYVQVRRKDVQKRWRMGGWLPQNMQMSVFWQSKMSIYRMRWREIKRSKPEDIIKLLINRFRYFIWKSYNLLFE